MMADADGRCEGHLVVVWDWSQRPEIFGSRPGGRWTGTAPSQGKARARTRPAVAALSWPPPRHRQRAGAGRWRSAGASRRQGTSPAARLPRRVGREWSSQCRRTFWLASGIYAPKPMASGPRVVVTNWCGFGDTNASQRALHSTANPRRRVAAAPAFHLVHLLPGAKADDRLHEVEVVEAQEAQHAPEPKRHLTIATTLHITAPPTFAKARRMTSLSEGGRLENQPGERRASVTSGVRCIPDSGRLFGARQELANSGGHNSLTIKRIRGPNNSQSD